MKKLLVAASLVLTAAQCVLAQPMSGNYTVGGNAPDFATLQDAARAVKSRGVSGAVFFNLRPATYLREDGMADLMVIDSTIAGTSPTNRITFQPDAATGGNVDNVILKADFNASSPPNLAILRIEADFITLRNLTFMDAESMDVPADWLIRISGGVGN